MNRFFVLYLLFTPFFFASCDFLDDDLLSGSSGVNIPSHIQSHISTQYTGSHVDEVYLEELCEGQMVYEVDLHDGSGPDIDLYYDLNWNFLFEATEITIQSLPSPVLASIQAQFSGYSIEPDELERLELPDGSIQYLVELDHASLVDLYVLFLPDGQVICSRTDNESNWDDDDDSDDDWDDDNWDSDDDDQDFQVQIPDAVVSFIGASYAGYEIDGSEIDFICGIGQVYEVDLEYGPGPDIDLYFTTNWNFLFEERQVSKQSLPDAVLAAIQAEFPGFVIVYGDIYRHDYPDGSVQYEFDLEGPGSEDFDVIIDESGEIICVEED